MPFIDIFVSVGKCFKTLCGIQSLDSHLYGSGFELSSCQHVGFIQDLPIVTLSAEGNVCTIHSTGGTSHG